MPGDNFPVPTRYLRDKNYFASLFDPEKGSMHQVGVDPGGKRTLSDRSIDILHAKLNELDAAYRTRDKSVQNREL